MTPPSYTEIDRGFEGHCWIIDRVVKDSKPANRWLTEILGERGPGELFQHRCEKWGEENRCVNPDHIFIGDKSTNTQHMHDLRAAAGVPWAGARPVGTVMDPEVGRKISESLQGREKTPEHRAAMSVSQKRRDRCECGFESTVSWVARHRKKEGH